MPAAGSSAAARSGHTAAAAGPRGGRRGRDADGRGRWRGPGRRTARRACRHSVTRRGGRCALHARACARASRTLPTSRNTLSVGMWRRGSSLGTSLGAASICRAEAALQAARCSPLGLTSCPPRALPCRRSRSRWTREPVHADGCRRPPRLGWPRIAPIVGRVGRRKGMPLAQRRPKQVDHAAPRDLRVRSMGRARVAPRPWLQSRDAPRQRSCAKAARTLWAKRASEPPRAAVPRHDRGAGFRPLRSVRA